MKLSENVSALERDLAEYINTALINAAGADVCAITLPSNGWVIIREQNGDDDGILSNASLQKDASSINLFVAAIVAYSPKAKDKRGILTLDEVLAMPIRDKYVIIIKSRIFSMGNTLEFQYVWDDSEGVADNYEEDLNRYVWDYTVDFPIEAEYPNFDAERVAPYRVASDENGWIYCDTKGKVAASLQGLSAEASIKRLRFKLLDGFAERKLLSMGESGMNINTKLITRELQLFTADQWHKVESFKGFNSSEMSRLRKVVADYDQEFEGNTEIDNPRTGAKQIVPLMAIPSFFFPQGI